MQVRRATLDDLVGVVDTLVAAHLAYAWERWLLPGPDRGQRLATLVETDLTLIGLPAGEVWVADDDGEVVSSAVWLPAGWQPPPEARIRLDSLASEALGDRRQVVEEVEARIAAHHPRGPRWLLATMGTRPERQRQGLGAAVLAPVLHRLDEQGASACCETSATDNVAFYGTVGFRPVAELVDLPGGAPPTWVLWRDARRTSPGSR